MGCTSGLGSRLSVFDGGVVGMETEQCGTETKHGRMETE